MKLKKLLSFIAAAAMAVTALTGSLSISASADNEYSGSAGENVTYSFDSTTGVLTISGTGPTYNKTYTDYPWYSWRKEIKEVVVEEGITYIGKYALSSMSNVEKITLPTTIEKLDECSLRSNGSLKEIVGLENTKITTIASGTFMNDTSLTSITIPGTVTSIEGKAFWYCTNKNLVIDIKSTILTTVNPSGTFEEVVGKAYVYSQDVYTLVTRAHTASKVVLKPNYEILKNAIENNEAKDTSDYTDDSAKVFTDAIAAGKAVMENANATQEEINAAIEAINTAIYGLTYKPADYTAVDEAIAKVPSDLSLYTYETANAVKKAVKAVEREKPIIEQEIVDSYVQPIEDSVAALVYKPADYTVVYEAIAKIPADLSGYTDDSVKAVNDAKEAVDYGKNISEQETVDGYVQAINDAVAELTEKPTEPKPTSNTTTNTPVKTTAATKTTRSSEAVSKDKAAAVKLMKQAKINKLTVGSKAKKKVTVSWKKVKKAVGYEVQVSTKKNFKKPIFKKFTAKTKLNIKNKKLKSGKKYYVRVRAYATYKDANGTAVKVYSAWNKKLRKVTVK